MNENFLLNIQNSAIGKYFSHNPVELVLLIVLIIVLIILWNYIWKGIALWKSAKSNHILWFIIFLFVNTMGILELLYIYVFNRKSSEVEKLPTDKIINQIN